jgi:WS/DGAT/MGAT family acyltransferase
MSALSATLRPVPDRATSDDLAYLAMSRGPVPQQLGAIMSFAGPDVDVARVERALAERIVHVPRLRQRLVRVPLGCGRPVWVDDAEFDIRHHVRRQSCRPPGDERALLDTAMDLIAEPLPPSRPQWCAVFITGLDTHGVALILLLHHVLADGIGGLAVLASLIDGPDDVDAVDKDDDAVNAFPRRPPARARLAVDALRGRLRALPRARTWWRALRMSMAAGGGLTPSRSAACSLNQRAAAHRRIDVVRVDHNALRESVHRHGATVNDAALTAVAGALHLLLSGRGEHVDNFAIAVPVAGRRTTSSAHLGNQVAPLLVTAPGTGDPVDRLRSVAAAVRTGKESATGPPPITLLGPLFRMAANLGGYQWYMNHQRRVHTLVSHVRGPDQSVTLGGVPIVSITPVVVSTAGNMTTSFLLMSYAGTLTTTVAVDPDRVPDHHILSNGLRSQFALLAAANGTGIRTVSRSSGANGRDQTCS